MVRKNNSSKRFGARYGSRTRKNVDEAEKRNPECPNCSSNNVKRTAAGVWECQECGKKTAGGAYKMNTGASEILQKALHSETEFEELEEAKEEVGE